MIDKMLKRTSVRHYSDKQIEKEKISILKEIANASPTSINGHQFSAIFIQDQKTKDYLCEKNWGQKHIAEAPLFILFVADLNRIDYVYKSKKLLLTLNL